MTLKQLSVFLENQPGALSAVCRLLAAANINILTFSLADTKEFGIFRLIVREWEKAHSILIKNGYAVKLTDVVALEVEDRPGGLGDVLAVLEHANVNLDYVYAVPLRREGKGMMVFRCSDPAPAIQALQAAQVAVVDTEGLLQRLGS